MEDMAVLRDYGKRVGVKISGKTEDDAREAVLQGVLAAANRAKTEKDVEWVKANKDLIDWHNDRRRAQAAAAEAAVEGGAEEKKEPEPKKAAAPKKAADPKKESAKKDALAEAKARAAAAKEKVAAERAARPAGRAKVADKKGVQWKEGSNAQDIFLLIKGAGKKGITLDDGIAAAKKAKVKSDAIEGRVRAIFAEAVQRGIATKSGDKFVSAV